MAEQRVVTAGGAGTIEIGGDLRVNRLGFGAMRITGKGIWGPPRNRDEAIAVLRRAVALDVQLIDTADSYGPEVSEELIAEALYPYPPDLVIATKGGLVRPGPNRWEPDGRPEHLRAACEGSLRRLRVEQIPVYQFHRPDPAVPLTESLGALAELQTEGKIKHLAICNVNTDQLREARAVATLVSVQNRYSIVDRESDPVVDVCAADGLAFLPWAPVQGVDKSAAVKTVAKRRKATTRQVALAWLFTRSSTMLPIPGTGSVSHLEENTAAAGLELQPEDLELLASES